MSGPRLSEIPVFFYRTSGGTEPVVEWLRSLPPEDRRPMPLCRPLGQGLWEVRSTLPSRRIARLLFFVHEDRIGVVHGFIKKTQKTPADDLNLARRRMKEMLE